MDFVKKFVSCLLVVVIMIRGVAFSAYSVPTSSAPASSAPASSAPASSAPASSAPTSSASASSAPTSSAPTSSAPASSAPTSSASASSAPTSSAPTSSAPASSIPLEDDKNLYSEFVPELVGGDAGFVLEVPEAITYTWVRCEDDPNDGSAYRWLHKECVMNCKSITEGYSLTVCGEYENILSSQFKSSFNFDGEILKSERVIFSQAGKKQVGCSLKVRKNWLDDFEDGEKRQAGTLTYSIEFLETDKLKL